MKRIIVWGSIAVILAWNIGALAMLALLNSEAEKVPA